MLNAYFSIPVNNVISTIAAIQNNVNKIIPVLLNFFFFLLETGLFGCPTGAYLRAVNSQKIPTGIIKYFMNSFGTYFIAIIASIYAAKNIILHLK